MFLKQRAEIHDVRHDRPRGRAVGKGAASLPPARRGGMSGLVLFAATFTAVAWIGGGALAVKHLDALRAERARLATMVACPAPGLAAADAPGAPLPVVEVSPVPQVLDMPAPGSGRSPLFALLAEERHGR